MDVEKVAKNLAHAAVIAATAYFATHTDSSWIWLLPGITWLGQVMEPPDVTSETTRVPKITRARPPAEVPTVPPS